MKRDLQAFFLLEASNLKRGKTSQERDGCLSPQRPLLTHDPAGVGVGGTRADLSAEVCREAQVLAKAISSNLGNLKRKVICKINHLHGF